MITLLPNTSRGLLRLFLFASALVVLAFISSKINPAFADDPWNCHNGCTRYVNGYVVDENGSPVSGVSVRVQSVSSWCDDNGCHDNELNEAYATSDGSGYFRGAAFNDGTYNVHVMSVPSGYISGSQQTTSSGWTYNRCIGSDQPVGSTGYDCQYRYYSNDNPDNSDNSCGMGSTENSGGRCNFKIRGAKPPTPRISLNGACSGPDGKYYGNDMYIDWDPTSPNVSYVDMRDASNGGWQNGWINTEVPAGRVWTNAIAQGWSISSLNYNQTLVVRTWNGARHSDDSNTVTIPPCAPSAPTVSFTPAACLPEGENYTGNDINISWPSSTPAVTYVDLSGDPGWGWLVNKYVAGTTSTTGLSGFTAGSYLERGRTYYVRTYNGSHSSNASFVATWPICDGYLQQPRVTVTPRDDSGSFKGTFGYSGTQGPSLGVNWYNGVNILVQVASTNVTIEDFYIGFYRKLSDGSCYSDIDTFLSSARSKVSNPQEGFLLWYNRASGNYYTYANGQWNILTSAGTAISSGGTRMFVGFPGNGTSTSASWGVVLTKDFDSKVMCTPVYISGKSGNQDKAAFDPNFDIKENPSLQADRLQFRAVSPR
jgi:hypothetical protein